MLASLIDSGAYERHVRRIRRENERRRATLLEVIARRMPDATQVEGSAAGLHVVVWLPWLPAREEPAVVEAARRRGVGVHVVSGLFAAAGKRRQSASAGFVGDTQASASRRSNAASAGGRRRCQICKARGYRAGDRCLIRSNSWTTGAGLKGWLAALGSKTKVASWPTAGTTERRVRGNSVPER